MGLLDMFVKYRPPRPPVPVRPSAAEKNLSRVRKLASAALARADTMRTDRSRNIMDRGGR